MSHRSDIRQYFETIRRSVLDAQDETCSVSLRSLLIGSTGLVGRSAAQTETLLEAARSCASTFNCLHGGYYNRVEHGPAGLSYRIDDADFPFKTSAAGYDRVQFMEGVLIYLHTFLSTWAGRDLAGELTAVHTRRTTARDNTAPDLLSYWKAPIRLGADVYGLDYRRKAALIPRGEGESSLQAIEIYDRIIAECEDPLRANSPGHGSLTDRITGLILSEFVTQTAVADSLGLSVATMRRRLASEGTTFRQVRADALNMRARRLLNARTDVATTASTLGFSDMRSFNRAFKAWNGVTPAVFVRDTHPA